MLATEAEVAAVLAVALSIAKWKDSGEVVAIKQFKEQDAKSRVAGAGLMPAKTSDAEISRTRSLDVACMRCH